MKKKLSLLLSLAFLLCTGLAIGPAGGPQVERTASIQPALAELAAASPGKTVRVMVGARGELDDLAGLVAAHGGEVVRELHILNSLALRMPAGAAVGLAQYASVNWLALDALVSSSAAPIFSVRDEFNSVSYSNNDGTANWLGPWDENDYGSDSPSAGYIFVKGKRLAFHWVYTGRSITRQVDLSGISKAELSFDWEVVGLDYNEDISILVSDSPSGPFTELARLANPGQGSAAYDISAFVSPTTTIRFENRNSAWEQNEYVFFDNVQILVAPDQNTYLDTLGVRQLHAEGITGQGVGVAVIDSGVAAHPDLAGRLSAPDAFSSGDNYGHGTHVAGIVAGDGSAFSGLYEGIAPGAQVISLGVSDSQGMAYESDVVAALEWVLNNKDIYNIRVVNLSLNSTAEGSYHDSGMDAAVEILWFNGVVVVASAGNKGPAGGHNTAKTAPANDPFIITVGAADEKNTSLRSDDTQAPFSSSGTTVDGFYRPDILAPGTDIYSALCANCSWEAEYPGRVSFGGDYFRLSGTSMAAPMVTGAVSLLLSDEPGLTPDQVKYRLLDTAGMIGNKPYLDVYGAVHGTSTQPANQGDVMPHILLAKMAMIAYWSSANGDALIDWSLVDWDVVNWDNVDWNAVNWNSVNWNSVNWNSVNWNSVNWNSVNWNSVNWNSVNWNSANWNSVNWNSVNWNSARLDGVFWGPGKGRNK